MPVSILSTALIELGEDRITAADQDTERARIVNEVYEDERDALLEEHPWNFALGRAALALLPDAPAFGFSHAHKLPSDFLAVVSVTPDVEYQVEGDTVLSDEKVIYLRYVRRVEVVGKMPPTFKSALATRIAARVAKKVTGSSAEKERMEALYKDRLRIAKSRDAQGGGSPDVVPPNVFTNARRW